RCPVGALFLDPSTGLAGGTDILEGVSVPLSHLRGAREQASSRLVAERAPFVDPERVEVQMARAIERLPRPGGSRALRTLVRNVFLISGNASRMSIRGDNSDWAEVVTSSGAPTRLIGAAQIDA